MQITVVVCTYLREELLEITLDTLNLQSLPRQEYRVVVVDNAGSEDTEKVAANYGADYVFEKKLGVSHARNRGCQEATTPWVLYLDDDVKVPHDMIERFSCRLNGADFEALGGPIRHWFRTPPPRWLLKYYDRPYLPGLAEEFGPLPDEHFLVGCQIAVKRDAWEAIGGFSDEVGMHGFEVGRADENDFQLRLRKAGYQVYYDPNIPIDHLVQPYKYSIGGQLRLAYASGRDGIGMRGQEQLSLLGLIGSYWRITTYSLPFNVARLIAKPAYFWQNAVVDTVTKYCFSYAQFRGRRLGGSH